MNSKSVLKYASEQGAKFVSTRFTDLPGSWQHLTFPISELDEGSFVDGFGFDASSIRGWAAIHESDMLLIPDPYRAWMDPFAKEPTLCLICNAVDPISRQGYAFDPRMTAVRAETYLKSTGIADTANFGPEAEFFVFDSVQYENDPHRAGYAVNSDEGHWNSGRDANASGPNLGHRIRPKEGYVPCAPTDTLIDIRSACRWARRGHSLPSVECDDRDWVRWHSHRGRCSSDLRRNSPRTRRGADRFRIARCRKQRIRLRGRSSRWRRCPCSSDKFPRGPQSCADRMRNPVARSDRPRCKSNRASVLSRMDPSRRDKDRESKACLIHELPPTRGSTKHRNRIRLRKILRPIR